MALLTLAREGYPISSQGLSLKTRAEQLISQVGLGTAPAQGTICLVFLWHKHGWPIQDKGL
jgi:hypothetical protein